MTRRLLQTLTRLGRRWIDRKRNAKADRRRRLGLRPCLERLEDRQVLSGVTLVTPGWDSGASEWGDAMADEIRLVAPDVLGTADGMLAANNTVEARDGMTGALLKTYTFNSNVTAFSGLTQPVSASLGDRVFNDVNGNGIQGPDEPGIAGVTVNLLGPTGETVATTTTSAGGTDVDGDWTIDAAGTYRFLGVAPGPDQNGQPAEPISDNFEDGVIESSKWVTHGYYGGIGGVGAGSWQYSLTEVPAADGYLQARVWGPGSGNTFGAEAWIRTTKNFNDGNQWVINLTWDSSVHSSPHVDNFAIQISDGGTRDNNNWFWIWNEPLTATTNLWRSATDRTESDVDTPRPPFSKSTWSITLDPQGLATFYESPDASGVPLRQVPLDSTKPWYVKLLLNDATSAGFSAGDDTFRLYDFSASPNPTSQYRVEFVPPEGYLLSPQDQGTNDALDSDVDPATGVTPLITLQAGQTDDSWDAGMYRGATIRGTKWNDLDGDGVRDDGEPGLVGWRIYVDTNRNGQWDDGETHAITDANGDYVLSVGDSLVVDQAVSAPGFPNPCPGENLTYISPDAKLMLTSLGGEYQPSHVWRRQWDSQAGRWTDREQLLSDGTSNGYLSPDGNAMYLVFGDPPGGQGEIDRSRFNRNDWSFPERMANLDTPSADHFPAFNGRQIYWTGTPHEVYEADYVAATDQFSNPRPVDSINSEWSEVYPWVSSDGRLLIFGSDRPGGYGGYDLWYATRSDLLGDWENITNPGPNVNTGADENAGRIAEDVGLLFFTRWGKQGNQDNQLLQATVIMPPSGQVGVVAEELQPDWAQTAPAAANAPLLTVPNPVPAYDDGFGVSLAAMGSDFFVGAYFDNGQRGALYKYDIAGNQLPLALPSLSAGDWFGTSVATSGDRLLVGAQGDDTAGANAGAAYLYDGSTGQWAKIVSPSPSTDSRFGTSVAFVGDKLLVGAPYANVEGRSGAGAAYLFSYNASSGQWEEEWHAYGPNAGDQLGVEVAAWSNYILLGAPAYQRAGAAYLYGYDGSSWSLLNTFQNPTPAGYDGFGVSVAFVGGDVLVGASEHERGTAGGIAYLFDGTTHGLLTTFTNPTPTAGDLFGQVVRAIGDNVLVSAPLHHSGGTTAGAVYLFESSTGRLLQTFENPTPAGNEWFGDDVAALGNKVLIGCPWEDAGGGKAGAAYLFWGPDAGSGAGAYTLSLSPGQVVDNLDFGNRQLPNRAPADIALSNGAVAENEPAGMLVGTFSTTDPDAGDSFTYTLVSGTGGADNASFTIDGSQLKTAAMFDYDTKNSYAIRVRTTDQGGLWYEEPMVITVTDVGEGGLRLSFLPVSGSSLLAVPEGKVRLGVFATAPPEGVIGWQLDFTNSDGQLRLENWMTSAAWLVVLDGTLDTPGDRLVAAARLDAASGRLELGTFDVVAPMVAGEYRLTVNYVVGAPFDTAFVGERGLIPIEDFGDVIITVLDDAIPLEADLAAPLAGQLTNHDPGYIDVRWVDPGLPATGVNPLTIDVHDIVIDNGGRALSVDRVVILGGDIYRYCYGDDGETFSDGTVTVTFVGGEVEDMLGNPNVEETETFTFDGTPPMVTSVVINGGLVDPLDLPGRGSQPTSWAEQRSDIRTLVISFSEGVSTVTPADLELISLGVDAPAEADIPVPLTADQLSQAGNVLTIRFGRDQLPDGVYQLRVLPSVTDAAGNRLDGDSNGEGGDTYVLTGSSLNEFYQLSGDWNGDGAVTILDFPTLTYWFEQTVPPTPEYVDLNGDGGISILDFPVFRANFGKAVVFPVATIAIAMAGNLGGWDGNVSPDPTPSADQVEFVQSPASGSLEVIGGGFLVSAGPLHPYDVNSDLQVTSDDALEIIKFIDSPVARFAPHPVYDVNGDQLCTPLDALLVINFVNAAAGQVADSEGGVDAVGLTANTPTPSFLLTSQPSRLGTTLVSPEPVDGPLSSTELCASQGEHPVRIQTSGYPEWGRQTPRKATRVPCVRGDKGTDLADALDAELDAALRDIADDIASAWNGPC